MDRAGAVGNKCLIITLIIIPGGSELAREIVEGAASHGLQYKYSQTHRMTVAHYVKCRADVRQTNIGSDLATGLCLCIKT